MTTAGAASLPAGAAAAAIAPPLSQPRRSYAEGAALIASRGCRSLLVGVTQDALIPAAELRMLADTINASAPAVVAGAGAGASAGAGAGADAGPAPPQTPPGPSARFVSLDSQFGHDAFLLEPEALGSLVRAHLEAGIEADLAREALHSTGVTMP
jgi:hypothetical protein